MNTQSNNIILLHGAGSCGDNMDFLKFRWKNLYQNWNIIAPNGPLYLGNNSYAWFDLTQFMPPDGYKIDPDDLNETSANFWEKCNNDAQLYLEKQFNNVKKCVFIGFSQGGFVAGHMALHSLNCIGGVIFGGGILSTYKQFLNRPIHIIHGINDEVVTQNWYYHSLEFAKHHNLSITGTMINNLGHDINEEAILAAEKFLNTICM